MDGPVSAIQLALCRGLNLTRSPRQIIAYRFEYSKPIRKRRICRAVYPRTVQIPLRFLLEPKSVGHIELAFLRSLPLNVFDIAHSSPKAFGDKPVSDLLALLRCQWDSFFFCPGSPLLTRKLSGAQR